MSIKQENKRIVITLRPQDQELINVIKNTLNCKNNTKALRFIFDTYLINNKISR